MSCSSYETKCGFHIEYQDIEEDHPECRTERVEKCPRPGPDQVTIKKQNTIFTFNGGADQELSNLVGVEAGGCPVVEVRRCRIVTRTRRKARPSHQCKECHARTPTSLILLGAVQ